MSQVIDNIGLIIFVAVIVLSFVFNVLGAKLKEAAARAERSRDYQKKPQKFNPFGGESPEEFFDRIRQEDKPSPKLKLNEKHRNQKNTLVEESQNLPFSNIKEIENIVDTPAKTIVKKARIKHNKIDITDKKALRKAIIINEVLNPPKAYDL